MTADAASTGWVRLLLRFGRAVAGATSPDEILPLLAEATMERMDAAAVAVFQLVEGDGLRLVTVRGLPDKLKGLKAETDTIGDDLGAQVLAAAGPPFSHAYTLPFVSNGDLYGALVILGSGERPFPEDEIEFAAGLADLAAVSMAKSAQFAALRRSYENLRASKEVLARNEKLRSLGQMASGISHDLKNILTPLALQLQLLRRRIDKGPGAANEVIARMEEALQHGVGVVERLRDFSRQAPEREAEPVDLNGILATALELCRPREKAGARIEMRSVPGTPGLVLAHKSELVTAVVNLIFNAMEAVEKEGIITLCTGAGAGGGWIDVADNGPGMPPEVERRVFEPFFTTKEQGTGLGLAMVYSFVQRCSGKLTLETAPGKGTRFRLWFPAAP